MCPQGSEIDNSVSGDSEFLVSEDGQAMVGEPFV